MSKPHQFAALLDPGHRLYVARLLREHLHAGTIPPRWTVQQFLDRCDALGLRVMTNSAVGAV